MARVIMAVNSDFIHDARVQKEALALTRSGYEVTVFALTLPGPREQNHLGIRLVNPTTGKLARFPYRLSYLKAYWQTLRALLKEQAEVWHGHDLEILPFVYTAARLKGGKLVYDSHELWSGYDWPGRSGGLGPVRRLVWGAWLRLEKWLARRCHLVITVNRSCAREIGNRLGIQPPLVLRNCADPAQGLGSPYGGLRAELGLDHGEPLVVYVGLLQEGRGLENLVHAWSGLPVGAHLAFVGRGPAESGLKNLAERARLNNVHFLAPVRAQELPEFISGASVGVVLIEGNDLSKYYSLPNKLFEYLAAGVPVLASGLPEIRRLVEEYQVGVFADPRDPVSIRSALVGLLSGGNGSLEQLRQNALQASRYLTWQREVGLLINEYSKLTGKARK